MRGNCEPELEMKMEELAESFPSLVNTVGVFPWNPLELDKNADDTLSSSALISARFLLNLWDPDFNWAVGKFDIVKALSIWDAEHRASFLTWATDPWWP